MEQTTKGEFCKFNSFFIQQKIIIVLLEHVNHHCTGIVMNAIRTKVIRNKFNITIISSNQSLNLFITGELLPGNATTFRTLFTRTRFTTSCCNYLIHDERRKYRSIQAVCLTLNFSVKICRKLQMILMMMKVFSQGYVSNSFFQIKIFSNSLISSQSSVA